MGGHRDVTDQQWERLAEVVPLRGAEGWSSWSDHDPGAGPEGSNRQLRVMRIQIFADARRVAETVIAGIPVLLDLSAAEGDTAKRVLDFASGVVFGLEASIHRVESNVFLLTPAGTEVDQPRLGAAAPD